MKKSQTFKQKRHTKYSQRKASKRALKTEARRSHSKEVPRNQRMPVGKQDSKAATDLQVLMGRLNRMNSGRAA